MLRAARPAMFPSVVGSPNNIATLKAIFSKYRLQRGNEMRESLAEREKEGKAKKREGEKCRKGYILEVKITEKSERKKDENSMFLENPKTKTKQKKAACSLPL